MTDTATPPQLSWLTIPEAARLLKVDRRTIYNWRKAGKVQERRTPGGRVRILIPSAWMEKIA